MGLRCLLGCDWGEPEIEREREERGDEVIITVNEVKTCSRCGKQQLVSENTEVTSLDQLTETAADNSVAESPAADNSVAEPTTADESATPAATAGQTADTAVGEDVTIDATDPETDDGEVLTDDDPADLGTAAPDTMTVDDVEAAAAEPVDSADSTATDDSTVSAADDDGVILSDEPHDPADAETLDRNPGEWPEYDADETPPEDGDQAWPDPETEDEGFSAEEPTDPPEDMTFGGGFTPEITDTEKSMADDDDQLTFTRDEETTVEFEPTVDDIKTEFHCPECGLARKAGNSSMRAGDICPECKRGYISERPL
mgnify:CR=1 FL=1